MPDALAQAVIEACVAAGLTVGACETDTGGLIGSRFTDVPGCSRVFIGGIVPYHNPPKQRLAGVPDALLKQHGSVSEQAAVALAQGARDALQTDIAVAETGITGPTGGSAERPVGTVWIACVGPGDRVVAERHVWTDDREGNKRRTAERALELVRDAARAAAS